MTLDDFTGAFAKCFFDWWGRSSAPSEDDVVDFLRTFTDEEQQRIISLAREVGL